MQSIKVFRILKDKLTNRATVPAQERVFHHFTASDLCAQWIAFLSHCCQYAIVGYDKGHCHNLHILGLRDSETEILTFLAISLSKAIVKNVLIGFEDKERVWKTYDDSELLSLVEEFSFGFVGKFDAFRSLFCLSN